MGVLCTWVKLFKFNRFELHKNAFGGRALRAIAPPPRSPSRYKGRGREGKERKGLEIALGRKGKERRVVKGKRG